MSTLYKANLILPDWHIEILGGDGFISFLSIFQPINAELLEGIKVIEDGKPLENFLVELEEYLEGKRKGFSYSPYPLVGTNFQRAVWDELCRIPYGHTKTYAEIARTLGKASSSRAVGKACSANPIPILVPCHRVIRSDGSLGGFSSGLDIKKKLLFIENIVVGKR